ncbi:MAG: glycoside hydrolase family 97 catalytic domain-containing protein, partial [Candidatus Cryptobacteroides sp.]
MKKHITAALCLLCLAVSLSAAQRRYELASPDGKLEVSVQTGDSLCWSVRLDSETLLASSPISMTLADGTCWGVGDKPGKVTRRRVERTFETPIYRKAVVNDQCNNLLLEFKGFAVEFRAYGNGAAYRFISRTGGPLFIRSEQADFRFVDDWTAFVAYSTTKGSVEDQLVNNFENTYLTPSLSGVDSSRIAFLPVLVASGSGKKVCLTESDLLDYPGMFLGKGDCPNSLKGLFAGVPREVHIGGKRGHHELVDSREDYIASYPEGMDVRFPWRIAAVSRSDSELLDNDLVQCLATDPVGDFSWVRPGKVAWEWWNAWNLKGVDFVAGVNDRTYKYYIDFASENGIEYVILDEGWSVPGQRDLMQVVPEIHLKELVDYASQRNVGIILWAGYTSFSRDVEGICRHYAEMGIKGFKVDFMERDDQKMVDFQRKTAEIAARHHLIIDYHGTFKPAGINRTWPNVINVEGVFGLEMLKKKDAPDIVTYDVTIPFVRMLAGPMDYTQGAMRNATKENWRPVYTEPMSQGTRCRQLAEYVIFESPLNMLCDTPSAYKAEKECTGFISGIPTVWDSTVPLDGSVGEYVAVARSRGDEWYVGALTGWDARDLTLDLSFIPAGDYTMEVFRDGVNASKAASDYARELLPLPADRKVEVRMAPGGGWAARIFPGKHSEDYPQWLDTATIYHIYPSSFQDSDGDG